MAQLHINLWNGQYWIELDNRETHTEKMIALDIWVFLLPWKIHVHFSIKSDLIRANCQCEYGFCVCVCVSEIGYFILRTALVDLFLFRRHMDLGFERGICELKSILDVFYIKWKCTNIKRPTFPLSGCAQPFTQFIEELATNQFKK